MSEEKKNLAENKLSKEQLDQVSGGDKHIRDTHKTTLRKREVGGLEESPESFWCETCNCKLESVWQAYEHQKLGHTWRFCE